MKEKMNDSYQTSVNELNKGQLIVNSHGIKFH